MHVRVVTDAIVGGGFFLIAGDQVELAVLGEFAEAMLRDGAIELVEPILGAAEKPAKANSVWLF